MRTANYQDFKQQVHISEDSPMYMENYERKHVERFYQSTKEQLLCWGEESTYIDSEFSTSLETQASSTEYFEDNSIPKDLGVI
ncbi:hypothetical protein [Flavobacterium foetidum]|uniref:hypothetical protein n=1 Tax=Flavobacterium foetidum TaxID=2026681 RepID=UPI001074BE68|nr:hypothetical protein [Flavobacterium foetidum]KAF2508106.1 hypothetical protein E0W73_20110 [Flavobacterium foetidum]